MIKDLLLSEFLTKNRIDEETWQKADIEWAILQKIAIDHEGQLEQLGDSAALIARAIQKFEKVHSVRWRVKDPEHLIEKIVRKRAGGNDKYADIAPNNYFERVTDLVGIRALHLFKEDCLDIDIALKALWAPIEQPLVYKRAGDSDELSKQFEEKGFAIEDHPAGYRSVHYVIESRPINRKVIAEVQVRTIFEEGWSEIDHKVKYPNFSKNELVGYFLGIFNRMAGSADEMGGFVRGLESTIKHLEAQVAMERAEKEATLRDMEQTLSKLENVKEQSEISKESVARLKTEVDKLKTVNNLGNRLPSSHPLGLFGGINFIGSSAAEQAARGLTGVSAAEQLTRGLLSSSAAEQAARGLTGVSAAEQLTRGLLSSSAAEQAARGLMGVNAAEQLTRGLLDKNK